MVESYRSVLNSKFRRKNFALILSSPSGGGKTSLARALLEAEQNLILSISATTRNKRPLELDGRDYFFKTQGEFDGLIKSKQLLEYANVCGNYYGSFNSQLEDAFKNGNDMLFDIDVNGANAIKACAFVESVSIFIMPPSLVELEKRLIQRSQDSQETIKQRLELAIRELQHASSYDYIVLNDSFDNALQNIISILTAERMKSKRLNNLNSFIYDRK